MAEIRAPCDDPSLRSELLTDDVINFVASLVRCFSNDLSAVMQQRRGRRLVYNQSSVLPDFLPHTAGLRDDVTWRVSPLPPRLQCRQVDLGDVAPANLQHLLRAIHSPADGVQIDFDDGNCPSWPNQLRGLNNVRLLVHGQLEGQPPLTSAPVLMLRPRALNMIENHFWVEDKPVSGALFDYAVLVYHTAHQLAASQSGPFFYLPKMESHMEARMWNSIFTWTEQELNLEHGTIKACVLIENILAAFEMDEILYELREHSAGLNCGIWDYCASVVNKFGQRPEFVLPDRGRYVSMERHFLLSYMRLLVHTCHKRGAPATSGMVALVLPSSDGDRDDDQATRDVIRRVSANKLKDIQEGVDGFLVYDERLVRPIKQMFTDSTVNTDTSFADISSADLLLIPKGHVTWQGLQFNIEVGILFIYFWLQGAGHFIHRGAVEDSATAEISRSQVWQWLYYTADVQLDGEDEEMKRMQVTKDLVTQLVEAAVDRLSCHDVIRQGPAAAASDEQRHGDVKKAAGVFKDIVFNEQFVDFITTHLYEQNLYKNTFS